MESLGWTRETDHPRPHFPKKFSGLSWRTYKLESISVKLHFIPIHLNQCLLNDRTLGTNLTRLWLTGLFRNWLILMCNSSDVRYSLYFLRMVVRAIRIIIIDMCWPVQFWGPPLNGIKAFGFYNVLLKRLGLNSQGLSKYFKLVIAIPKPITKVSLGLNSKPSIVKD